MFAGREQHVSPPRPFQKGPGVGAGLEGRPEEQPAGRNFPVGKAAEVFGHGGGEGVAPAAVAVDKAGEPGSAVRVLQMAQRVPLADAAGVQVGGLLQIDQMREQILRGGQEAQPQSRREGLG